MAVTNILRFLMAYTSVVMIYGSGCSEHNLQYCSNCKAVSSVCTYLVDLQPLDLCEITCLTNPICLLGEHDRRSGMCFQYGCSQIEEDASAAGYFTLRKVCQLSDCLNYTLTTLHGQTGTCLIIETHTAVASLVDCSMLCLDTDSCRGSTFYGNGTCLLHDCENNTLGTNDTIFIKRSCFGDMSHMTSLPTSTLSKVTTKHSRPRLSTTSSSTQALTVETIRVTVATSSELPESAMTSVYDATLTTTLSFLMYTSSALSNANTAEITKSTNTDNNFLDKPINVAALASAGGVIIGAAVGMGVAAKCTKRVMRS